MFSASETLGVMAVPPLLGPRPRAPPVPPKAAKPRASFWIVNDMPSAVPFGTQVKAAEKGLAVEIGVVEKALRASVPFPSVSVRTLLLIGFDVIPLLLTCQVLVPATEV